MADPRVSGGMIPSILIPQADHPELVADVINFIARSGRRPEEGEGGFTPKKRHLDYACQAAALLGFLDSHDEVTEAGRILLTLIRDLQLLRLVFAFESSEVGQAWITWAQVKELSEVDPTTASRFLSERAANADTSTTERRADTLRSWAEKFRELRNREAGPNLSFGDWSPPEKPAHESINERNVFVEDGSDRVLRSLAPTTRQLRIASGFFTISGYLRVAESLTVQAVVKLLIGQDDRNPFARRSERDAAEILALFRASLGQGLLDGRRRHEMKRLHEHLLRTLVRIRRFEPRKTAGLHAKVYLFDRRAAYVTSANLTLRGLQHNIEAGRLLTAERERVDIEHFVSRYDQLFAEAKSLSPEIVQALEESWAFKNTVSPHLFFLKVMSELYDRLPPVKAESRKPLADFQRRVVTPVIAKILSYRRAMLIAPVGSGKTLMASYVAAYLQQEKHVRRIVVVCPNDEIAEKWRLELNIFDLPVDIVTHGVLRRDNEDLAAENRRLLQQLRMPRSDRFIIVDECHHFRGDGTQGWQALHDLLHSEGMSEATTPYALLVTATPVSISLDNLNVLLALIGEDQIEAVEEIEKRDTVVIVTLPFILTHYGMQRTGKRGRALRFGTKYLYYPELQVGTERYHSPMEPALRVIERLHLDFEAGSEHALEIVTADDEAPGAVRKAGYGPMLRTMLARRAESSPNAIQKSIQRLREGVAAGSIRPVHPELLLADLDELEGSICLPAADSKLDHLVGLLRAMKKSTRKVLIFSEAVATVEYLAERLKRAFPRTRLRFITGATSSAERHEILHAFPGEIDILVCSNASAEGVDLPGARMVVNYDLSWTPLTLAQRVGRIDRPTEDLHEVRVANFYPGSEQFNRLVKLWQRLDERAKDLDALTTTRVVGEHERPSTPSPVEALGLVRGLYEQGNADCFLAVPLPTPSYLQAWLAASPEQLRAAAALPDGIQSGQPSDHAGCYVFLRHEGVPFAVFRDRHTGRLRSAPVDVGHETLIKEYAFAEPGARTLQPPESFDDEVAETGRLWAVANDAEADDITIVAAKYLGASSR